MMSMASDTGKAAPKVSIGLPVYNGEDYIEQAISTLLRQSFSDFELIISDNASKDGTRAICERFAADDPRVRYSRVNRNLGAAPNYNRIVPMARGSYFKWAAHDDRCLPRFLEACVKALDEDPSVVLAYPATIVIDKHGDALRTYRDGLDLPQAEPQARFAGYIKQNYLHRRGMCNPIFGVVRMNALRRTRLIQDFLASDRSLLGHLALLGRFRELEDPLFERRIHMGTSTLAVTDFKKRQEWFNAASIKPSSHKKRNNFLSLRRTHIEDYFAAIDELVDDRKSRRACKATFTYLLITRPKWLYRDIKYTLGGQPSPERIMAMMQTMDAK